ncbi:MAG TPA: glycosyltransferase [Gemmatimonadales bacterium]
MTEPGGIPDVSVVICTYNRVADLLRVLDVLERQTGLESVRWELVVVDNNSSDGTREAVGARIAAGRLPLRYLFEPVQGKAHALNRAIRETAAPILAFTDDDVLLTDHWLSALVAPFADPACMGVGGAVTPVWLGERPAWASESEPYRMMGAIVQYAQPVEGQRVTAPPIGANSAWRREVFERHGLFVEELGHSGGRVIPGEDIEFGQRVMHRGETIIFSRRAEVGHPVTLARLNRRYFEHWYFQRGRLEAFVAGYRPTHPTRIAGVPRYLLRELPSWGIKWLSARDPRGRFYFKLRAMMAAGAIREFYRRRNDRAA